MIPTFRLASIVRRPPTTPAASTVTGAVPPKEMPSSLPTVPFTCNGKAGICLLHYVFDAERKVDRFPAAWWAFGGIQGAGHHGTGRYGNGQRQ